MTRAINRSVFSVLMLVGVAVASPAFAQDAAAAEAEAARTDGAFTLYDPRLFVGVDAQWSGPGSPAITPAFEFSLLSDSLSIFGRVGALASGESTVCAACADLAYNFGDERGGFTLGLNLGVVTTNAATKSAKLNMGPMIGYSFILADRIYMLPAVSLNYIATIGDGSGSGMRAELLLRSYVRIFNWLFGYGRIGAAFGSINDSGPDKRSFGGFEFNLGIAIAVGT